MEHNDYFDRMSKPPKEALKAISGGRLKGMTDIKPQWRNRAMTELFGLCGFGWKYEIDKQWTEPCSNGEVMCFVNIRLYVKIDDVWSDAIPATGGSHIVELEKNYDWKSKIDTPDEPKKVPYANDEGYKMALTDALSVAMQRIGIAGAIYEGAWNGSKYRDDYQPQVESGYDQESTLQWVSAIESTATMQDLQQCFADAWKSCKDQRSRNEITAAKDKRKKELA
jgi:hypothetical protein